MNHLPADSNGHTEIQLDTTQDYEYRVRSLSKFNVSGASNTIGIIYEPSTVKGQYQTSLYPYTICSVSRSGSLYFLSNQFGKTGVFDMLSNGLTWSTEAYNGLTGAGISWDDQKVAVCSGDGLIRVIRIGDGNQVQAIGVPASVWPIQVILDSDGSKLYSCYGNVIYCWSTLDGSQMMATPPRTYDIARIDLSPDGNTLACATGSIVELWDVPSGVLKSTLSPGMGVLQCVKYGPNGLLLVVTPGEIEFWNLSTGSKMSAVPGRFSWGWNQGGTFNASGTLFFADNPAVGFGPGPHEIGIWRVSDGLLLQHWANAPDESQTTWLSIPYRNVQRNVVQTVDVVGKVWNRTLSSVWEEHNW